MNETACLLLIGGAALLMASTLLRLPVRVRVAVVAAVLMALSVAGIDPITISPEFTIASLS
jgi:predicted benzoate:H+ symporter BenE